MTNQVAILSDKALTAKIAAAAKAASKLDTQLLEVSQDVARHYHMHKDVGMVNKLYLALGKGARHAAMAEWMLAFLAVKANTGKDKAEKPFVTDRAPNGEWNRETNLEAALANPWHDFKKSPTPDNLFDFKKAIKVLVGKYNKAETATGVTPEQMAEIAAMAGIPASDVKRPAEAAKKAEEAVGVAPL